MAKRRRNAPAVNGYNTAHAQVNRDARAMERVREGGYGALDKTINKLYRRLSSTQKGQARRLTSSNARNLDLILKATQRNRMADRRLTRETQQGLSAYGDAGGMLAQEFSRIKGSVQRAASASGAERKADIRATRSLDQTARGVIGITKANTKESEANASQLAVEELDRRTTSDLALIAQQHHDIAMQKLQAQQQAAQAQQEFENAKKLAVLNAKLATQGVDPTNAKMVTTAVRTMGSIGAQAMALKAQQPGLTPQEAANLLLSTMPGFAEMSPGEQAAINQVINKVFTNNDPDAIDPVAQEVMDIIRQQPGWDKLGQGKKDHLRDWIVNQIKSNIPVDWTAVSAEVGDVDTGLRIDNTLINQTGASTDVGVGY